MATCPWALLMRQCLLVLLRWVLEMQLVSVSKMFHFVYLMRRSFYFLLLILLPLVVVLVVTFPYCLSRVTVLCLWIPCLLTWSMQVAVLLLRVRVVMWYLLWCLPRTM